MKSTNSLFSSSFFSNFILANQIRHNKSYIKQKQSDSSSRNGNKISIYMHYNNGNKKIYGRRRLLLYDHGRALA